MLLLLKRQLIQGPPTVIDGLYLLPPHYSWPATQPVHPPSTTNGHWRHPKFRLHTISVVNNCPSWTIRQRKHWPPIDLTKQCPV